MTNNKRETVLKISKHLDDPSMAEELLALFDERKKEAIDYRRGGVITIFVGIGTYFRSIESVLNFLFCLFPPDPIKAAEQIFFITP